MRIQINSKALRLLREERAWTQTDLADATLPAGNSCVSLPTIKRIEASSGYYTTIYRVAQTLAFALGVEVEQLMLPIHSRVYDIGGDMLMDLSSDPTPEQIRADTEAIISLMEQRRAILNRSRGVRKDSDASAAE